MNIETACLHAGYQPGNGEPCALPIYQSTTYNYDSTEQVAGLFDLTVEGHMYSRISNPTVDAVEQKLAALEGGVGALCTTSGQSATFISLLNILEAGDHVVSSSTIYGGTVNLFSITFKKFGVDVSYVDPDASEEEIASAFRPNTKAVFGETMANPAMNVLDIEKFARVAHSHGVPLVVDNTFGTPYLCRPFEWGADVVVHSTTKYLDGHAQTVGGVIIDSGESNWTCPMPSAFPGLTTPESQLPWHRLHRAVRRCRLHHQGPRAAYARPGLLSPGTHGVPAQHGHRDAACSHGPHLRQRPEGG